MSGISPSSVLFTSDGYELAVSHNSNFATTNRALLIAGLTNSTNKELFALASEAGALGSVQMSNKQAVQIASVVTASGSASSSTLLNGAQEVTLVVNVGTVTGAGSIQYTIQEVDPGNGTTPFGPTAQTVVINNGNAPGVFTAKLSVTSATDIAITWTVVGSFSATIYSTIITKSTPSTQAVSGTVAVTQSTSPWVVSGTVTSNQGTPNSLVNAWPTTLTDGYGHIQGSAVNPIYVQGNITANNSSVGSNNAASLAFDTQVGGIVSTAAPTYTNGNLSALSLTTLGGLRIDGVYASGTANGTAANLAANGGYVTTSAPTYTNGQLSALSLDTSGNLRVSGFVTTNKAANSTVTGVATTSNTNTTLLASNGNRVFASIFNSTGKTMYIKLGATASTTSFTIQLFDRSYWEVPNDYTGIIDAFSLGTGTVLVTELTP